MSDIIFQLITTLCLILGVVSGEAISNRIFGYTKKWYLNIIEIFLFVFLLILMFNNIYVKELNPIIIFLLNFAFGITAITAARSITSGAGFFSYRIKQKYFLKKELNEDLLIIGLTRNLLNKGMNKESIKELLENSGFNKKKTRKVIKNIDIDKEEAYGTKRNY